MDNSEANGLENYHNGVTQSYKMSKYDNKSIAQPNENEMGIRNVVQCDNTIKCNKKLGPYMNRSFIKNHNGSNINIDNTPRKGTIKQKEGYFGGDVYVEDECDEKCSIKEEYEQPVKYYYEMDNISTQSTTNKKRKILTNNDDGNNQNPPPDLTFSFQQLQQHNQILLQLQQQQHLHQQQIQQLQQQLQQLSSTSINNNDKESMEEVPYNDENQSQQMNRYGDISTEIPDGYSLNNPPVVDNNDFSSEHYSSPQLLPTPFIHDDEPNVQSLSPVELYSPLIEQHSEQPLIIPDYNNTQQTNQSANVIGIQTPPLLPLLPSPTLSPLINSTYQLGENDWKSPTKVNEIFKQSDMNGEMINIIANENANANTRANDNSNRKMKMKKCNNYDNETLHKVKRDTIEIENVKEKTDDDIKKYNDYINGNCDCYRCNCYYCHKEVNTYDVCRYNIKGYIICKQCVIDRINKDEIENLLYLKGYYDDIEPCNGEIEYKCSRLKHTAPLYRFIKFEKNEHKILKLCRDCRLIKSFEHVISERKKSKKLML